MLSPALRKTLVMTAQAMRDSQDDWWIIGSAAVALHGAAPITVADVDVLMSVADARRILRALGVGPVEASASSLFRSTVFGRWTAAPLVVEIMADFHVATDSGWMSVVPETRTRIVLEGHDVFVPEREDLAAMLRKFGRPKDLVRAKQLRLPF